MEYKLKHDPYHIPSPSPPTLAWWETARKIYFWNKSMNELIKMITQLGSPTLFFVFYTKGHQMLSMIVFTKCCDFSEGTPKLHPMQINNIVGEFKTLLQTHILYIFVHVSHIHNLSWRSPRETLLCKIISIQVRHLSPIHTRFLLTILVFTGIFL